MKWISVKDGLPEIPKGKYGVQVLIAEFDPVFEECNSGGGYSIHESFYGSTFDRDGKKKQMFKNSELDFEFQELYYGNFKDKCIERGPTDDEVTHWMYLPDPPERN